MKNSSQSQEKSGFSLTRENTEHRTEWCAEAKWCAEAEEYRCMRCGRGSKFMKMPGKCTGPKYLSEFFGKWRKRHLGGHDLLRRKGKQGEILIWCRRCSGCARQRMGPKLMNCCRPQQVGTQEHGEMLKIIPILEDGRVHAKEANKWKIEGQKGD